MGWQAARARIGMFCSYPLCLVKREWRRSWSAQVLARLVTKFVVSWPRFNLHTFLLPLLYVLSSVTHFLQTHPRCVVFSWERGGDPSPRASLPRVPGSRHPGLTKARSKKNSERRLTMCQTIVRMCGQILQILTAIRSFPPPAPRNCTSAIRALYEGRDDAINQRAYFGDKMNHLVTRYLRKIQVMLRYRVKIRWITHSYNRMHYEIQSTPFPSWLAGVMG